ncbi:PIR Superfamily Protein [Plasmodium ovale wallikeri]|uniref:PIR Superfamily Protein n=1 Tax=Plasmodium ovale wallikeri TaxID=864142 RepID=A0A1A9A8H5_PLAOA|nr:PIR Superfamily Protein [Plasmodium ovale wallikeri]SBT56582.1 PIR Superfamily Protein [Plasmodium ovale wallikeri]
MNILKTDIPSIKYKDIWNDGICYNEINEIIVHNKDPQDADTWTNNFRTQFYTFLEMRADKFFNYNPKKRCRDLYYILYYILYKIKNLRDYEESYENIKLAIKNYMDSALGIHDYAICIRDSFNEDCNNYNKIEEGNKKKIDDLCEDIDYTKKNYDKINKSSECAEIKKHIDHQYETLKEVYNANSQKYSDVLGYYEFTSFNELDNIIKKIQCSSDGNLHASAQALNPDRMSSLSGGQISIILFLSLFGCLLVCFFLYKHTSLGLWLNNRIGKKIKFFNKMNYENNHEIIEEMSGYLQDNLHNEEYNVLYHSSGE